MAGFSFGLVSWLLKNRFQFRFQFCLRAALVSGFQFRFKFRPRKLFYCEYVLFKSVVLKLGSTEPQGFGEAVAGVRLRSE